MARLRAFVRDRIFQWKVQHKVALSDLPTEVNADRVVNHYRRALWGRIAIECARIND